MELNLGLELVRITEAAALAAGRENGRGDESAPRREAAAAVAHAFADMRFIQGEVVVGAVAPPDSVTGAVQSAAGAPLAIGSHFGSEGREVDIAVNPLEGGVSCALGGPNAMSIMALADQGSFLRCPAHIYMSKIATAADGKGVVDLDASPKENLESLARKRGCYVGDLTVVILDRPRHDDLIEEVRSAGARVKLIPDGDVAAAMACAREGSDVDLLFGTGGAAQGILSAAAIKCMGGVMECRFAPRSPAERDALYEMGITDTEKKLTVDDMAAGDIMFAATGVTDGEYLRGVKFGPGGATSHSVVMRSASATVRLLETHHRFDYKPSY